MLLHLKNLLSLSYRIPRAVFLEFWSIVQPSVEFEEVKIHIDHNFSRKMRRTLRGGSYEKEELQILKSQLSENDIVMEIGTGIGLLSSYSAKRIGSSRVFSYEGNPSMEPYIRHTYSLNHVSPSFESCLIGEQVGEQIFYVDKNFYASSTIQHNSEAKGIKVSVKSFNEEIYRINPTFLIIDIEGGEYELSKYADFYNVQKILVEVHGNLIGDDKIEFFKNKLFEIGFKLDKSFSTDTVYFLERNHANK